jgi:hypothetical protein
MSIPGWHVVSWPKVVAGLGDFKRVAPSFQHLSTTVEDDEDEPGLHRGQAVWGAELGGRRVGIAWEWREVRTNVVAMDDPMVVLANVELRDEQGRCLADGPRLLALHTLIHGLPWQDEITLPAASPAELRLAA